MAYDPRGRRINPRQVIPRMLIESDVDKYRETLPAPPISLLPPSYPFSHPQAPLPAAAASGLPADAVQQIFPVAGPVNPEAPAGSPPPSGNALSSWQNFLKLLGGRSGEHLDAGSGKKEGGNWSWIGDLMFRNNQRGFDLFGLAPQEVYWENLQGSGLDRLAPNRIPVDAYWRSLQNAGNWGVHADPGAAGVAGDWLKQDLDQLQRVWGQLSAGDRQMFRDRLLNGTGLPAYLQAFLKARPQWITDYISNTFKV